MEKTLIIEIKYGGLGDHLFHSHIPRLAKELGGFDKVYISALSLFRHPDYKKIVWEYNPFVDGFVEENGISVDIAELIKKLTPESKTNLLDEVMYAIGLDNQKLWNEPEIFYKPKLIEAYQKVIYDPNYLSWVGEITKEDVMSWKKKMKIDFEAIMLQRSEKFLYISSDTTKTIETPTLEDFCDLIFSAKDLFCLTSGTATLAAAMGKKAKVLFGKNQEPGFQHSELHDYILIPKLQINRLKRLIKKS